jgi:hypothetical protein
MTVANIGYVAGRFEASRRREALSFEHYQAVAAIAHLSLKLATGKEKNEHRSRFMRCSID